MATVSQVPWIVNLALLWRVHDFKNKKNETNLNNIEIVVLIDSVIDSNGVKVEPECIDYLECLNFPDSSQFFEKTTLKTQRLYKDDIPNENGIYHKTINPFYNMAKEIDSNTEGYYYKKYDYYNSFFLIRDPNEKPILKDIEDIKLNGWAENVPITINPSFRTVFERNIKVNEKNYTESYKYAFPDVSLYKTEAGTAGHVHPYAVYDDDLIEMNDSNPNKEKFYNSASSTLFFVLHFKPGTQKIIKKIAKNGNNKNSKYGNYAAPDRMSTLNDDFNNIICIASNPFMFPKHLFTKGAYVKDDADDHAPYEWVSFSIQKENADSDLGKIDIGNLYTSFLFSKNGAHVNWSPGGYNADYPIPEEMKPKDFFKTYSSKNMKGTFTGYEEDVQYNYTITLTNKYSKTSDKQYKDNNIFQLAWNDHGGISGKIQQYWPIIVENGLNYNPKLIPGINISNRSKITYYEASKADFYYIKNCLTKQYKGDGRNKQHVYGPFWIGTASSEKDESGYKLPASDERTYDEISNATTQSYNIFNLFNNKDGKSNILFYGFYNVDIEKTPSNS